MKITPGEAAVLRAAGPDVLAVVAKAYAIGAADGRREQAELDHPWIPVPSGSQSRHEATRKGGITCE